MKIISIAQASKVLVGTILCLKLRRSTGLCFYYLLILHEMYNLTCIVHNKKI